MTWFILGPVVVLLIYYYCWEVIKEYWVYDKTMRALPAPKGLPFIEHLKSIIVTPEELFPIVRNWCLQFSVFRISAGPYHSVHICKPDDIEKVLSATKHMSKSRIYQFLYLWMGEGLLTSSGSKWHLRRKILTQTFHFAILQKFLKTFNKETDKLVSKFTKECDKSYTEIRSYISDMTLNTIAETSMGFKIDTDDHDSKMYRENVYEESAIVKYRLTQPWYYGIFWYISLTGIRELHLVKKLHRFTEKVISTKAKSFETFDETQMEDTYFKRNKMAMLDLLLNAKIKERTIDNVGIRDEVNTFMFEGHDTTAVSLGFTLMLLANHKNIQDRIVEEMAEKIQDWEQPPTYNELQELKYMERCIKESLRLYPSVPFIARTLSENVVTSEGYTLPKEAECMIHIYDVHRNPDLWEDPDKFDPDRFLPENCQGRHPFQYIPFSAGPRNCIGQRYAILELKSVLCGILKKFELHPIDTPDTLALYQDLVLRTRNSIKIKFVPRMHKV